MAFTLATIFRAGPSFMCIATTMCSSRRSISACPSISCDTNESAYSEQPFRDLEYKHSSIYYTVPEQQITGTEKGKCRSFVTKYSSYLKRLVCLTSVCIMSPTKLPSIFRSRFAISQLLARTLIHAFLRNVLEQLIRGVELGGVQNVFRPVLGESS